MERQIQKERDAAAAAAGFKDDEEASSHNRLKVWAVETVLTCGIYDNLFLFQVSWKLDGPSFDSDALTERFSKVSRSALPFTCELHGYLILQYGYVVAVVVGPTKKKTKARSALVEFSAFEEAVSECYLLIVEDGSLSFATDPMAIPSHHFHLFQERALIGENSIRDNALTVSWLVPPPAPTRMGRQSPAFPAASGSRQGSHEPSPRSNSPFTRTDASVGSERDFESVVLMRMRQAEERKRLTEQMQAEDRMGDGNS